MGGNPGENLILFVFYISIIGLVGAIIVVVRIKISDYVSNKKAKETADNENEKNQISN